MKRLSQSLLAEPYRFTEYPEIARMRRRETQTTKSLREFASSGLARCENVSNISGNILLAASGFPLVSTKSEKF